ncbi:MAG: FecR domain-containing protein [Brachymonas sp.]|nr:FecR domain-containing protein [Brachymonas sp.]
MPALQRSASLRGENGIRVARMPAAFAPNRICALLLALLCGLLCWAARPAWAQQAMVLVAGNVSSLQGQAVVERNGQVLPLIHGSAVLTGDVVVTRPNARVDLAMSDGAVVQVQPNSRLKLNDYRMTTKPKDARSFMQLVEGGLRTVSGWIGQLHKDENYQLETPTAMIGVRGTDYSVVIGPQGVTVQVHEGAVAMCNSGGCVTVAQGQAATAASMSGKPSVSGTALSAAGSAAGPVAAATTAATASQHPADGRNDGGRGADNSQGTFGLGGYEGGRGNATTPGAQGNAGNKNNPNNQGNSGRGWGVGGTPAGGQSNPLGGRIP